MSTRPRKGSSALSHVSNHSSNNSSGSAKYSERSAMTTISSRNTSRKVSTTSGPLSSSPLLDSRKSSSVYDEILKTAFKKKKPLPSATTSGSTTTTTTLNPSTNPSSSSTGIKPKTPLTPTKRNLDKTNKDTSKSSAAGLKTKSTASTTVESTQSKELPQQDPNNDQQQIPTRDTTEHTETNIHSDTPPSDEVQQEDPVKETHKDDTEEVIPSKLEEELVNDKSLEVTIEKGEKEPEFVVEKPIIDISKISALIETEKELLNHTEINNSKPTLTIPSTPSERIASLTEEEKIKVKNLAARNLKYNNYEELFESPTKDGTMEDLMDNTIVNNISVIEPKEEQNPIKEEIKETPLEEGESTPVSIPTDSQQFSQILQVEETPIVKKELNTSIDSESSYGSYMEESDVVVFESPNKDEREVQMFSPIQKDEVMEPLEMNESFTTASTEKLEAHLQKTVDLEKENQLLELEIKYLEKELKSNIHNQEKRQPENVVYDLPKHEHFEKERDERPYFEDSESEDGEEPVQEEIRHQHPIHQPQIIEISREELIKPRAFLNHQILFQEVKKELKRNIQEIKPIKIPEVFIRETIKSKQEIKIISTPLEPELEHSEQYPKQEPETQEPEPELEPEQPEEQEPEPEIIEQIPIVSEPVKVIVNHHPIIPEPKKQVEHVDEDLEFDMELQKIVGEDFRRKKITIMDPHNFVERGASSPIARLRRRVQTNSEASTVQPPQIEPTNVSKNSDEQPKPSSHRLAGYKARRDARMKLLEKQEISITLLSNNDTSEVVTPTKDVPPVQNPPQPSANIPIKKEETNEPNQQITLVRSRTSITSEKAAPTTDPVKDKPPTSTTTVVVKERSEESTISKEEVKLTSLPEKKEKSSSTLVAAIPEVKTSRKKFEEVIIISPPRNPPPVVHHMNPQIQIDQETVDAIVPEDTEKVVLLKKTEALLSKSRERHSSPIRKIEITKETESPNVSFVTSLSYNNQSSLNQSMSSIIKDDPKQETLNRVNHLEKFMKDLKKKKQDELDVLEKKFDEMKSYFSQELGTRDSEIHNLTNQNQLLRDKLAVAQSQIDDLSIVIEHILETQEVLEVQLKKKPKGNKLTSPLIEAREDEPVSPVSYPGNDIQNNLSPVSSTIPISINHEDLQENQPTPLAFSKEDINVDLSIDGEFYLSFGKASLPLGEYVKTL